MLPLAPGRKRLIKIQARDGMGREFGASLDLRSSVYSHLLNESRMLFASDILEQ